MSDARGLMYSTVSDSGAPSTKFDLSHELKTTLNGGSAAPIGMFECVPGEIHDLDVRSFFRLMPMTFPIFQRLDLYVHAFFVPSRILWSGWNEFIWNSAGKVTFTEQKNWTPPVKPIFTLKQIYSLIFALCEKYNAGTLPWSPSTVYHPTINSYTTASLLTAYVFTGDKRFLTNRYFGQNYSGVGDSTKEKNLTDFIAYLLGIDIPSLSSLPNYLHCQFAVNEWVLGYWCTHYGSSTGIGTNSAFFNKLGELADASVSYNWQSVLSTIHLNTYNDSLRADLNRTDNFDFSRIIDRTLLYQNQPILTDSGVDALFMMFAFIITEHRPSLELMPFHAYLSIYNEYYRDENLDNYIDFPISGGYLPTPDSANCTEHPLRHILFCKSRAWQHDYFTSCFPDQSRNNVLIPLNVQLKTLKSDGTPGDVTAAVTSDETDIRFKTEANGTIGIYEHTNVDSKVGALSASTSSLMDDLRTGMHIQRMWDKISRLGSRVREAIEGFFPHAKSENLSPDEPVYLGGSSIPITISEVTQTSASDASSALGDMAGHGTASGSSSHIHLETHEHGFFVIIASVRPRSGYSQGLPKMFRRWTYLDYAWPDLARLGEQPVTNDEIYHQVDLQDATSASNQFPIDGMTFGYIPRYSEYKYINDSLSGDFRNSNFDDWHLSRKFGRAPVLNSQFVHVNTSDTDRVFAYEDSLYDHFVGVFYFDYQAVRPLPMYSDPTF